MRNIRKIAIFASGEGTNTERIIKFFKGHKHIRVTLLVCNKKSAPVIKRAEGLGVNILLINNDQLNDIKHFLIEDGIDYIVLAGFLRKIPEDIVNEYEDRIFNVHPSLLPKFGGKGMYGSNVHEAVIESGEKKSGITIHLVNKEYDKGKFLLQAEVMVGEKTTPESLAKKIHMLEYLYYPGVIEEYIIRNFK